MLKQVLSLVSFTGGDHWVFLDLDFSPEGFKAKNLVVFKKMRACHCNSEF